MNKYMNRKINGKEAESKAPMGTAAHTHTGVLSACAACASSSAETLPGADASKARKQRLVRRTPGLTNER